GTLRGHGEFGPTSCPCNRYDQLWRELEQEGEMSAEDRERIARLEKLVAGPGSNNPTDDVASLVAMGVSVRDLYRLVVANGIKVEVTAANRNLTDFRGQRLFPANVPVGTIHDLR